jgi:hypothetical protein
MRGVYTVSFDQQTIAAASGDYDLFEITAADDKPVELVALSLGNKSEVGDAQDEMLAYSVLRTTSTSGNGTSATPQATDPSDGAASFTAEVLATTPSTGGTETFLLRDTFNVRAGLMLVLPDIMRFKAPQATLLTVRLTTAVADDLTLSGTLWLREV